MEDRPLQLELIAKLIGIAEIAVVREGELALLMVDLDRLTVCAVVASRRAVADVTDRHGRLGKACKPFWCEDLTDQSEVLVRTKDAVIVDHDAAALLPSVLEGVEPVIGKACYIDRLRRKHTEYTAFLM